ncbi:MAG: hypothetical protein O2782_23560 [bacterium]|nr:hypothetical protein [bacterium]
MLIAVLLTILFTVAPGRASDSVGHLDLAALGFAPTAEPAVDLQIGAAEFDLAALAAQATDPNLAAVLANVDAFHLQQFVPPDAATVIAASNLATALITAGWLPAQSEFQGTRQIVVYVRLVGPIVAGLAVVAVDAGREVSIANVVGNILPQQLATLGLPLPN